MPRPKRILVSYKQARIQDFTQGRGVKFYVIYTLPVGHLPPPPGNDLNHFSSPGGVLPPEYANNAYKYFKCAKNCILYFCFAKALNQNIAKTTSFEIMIVQHGKVVFPY